MSPTDPCADNNVIIRGAWGAETPRPMSILENPTREPASDVAGPMAIEAGLAERLYRKAKAGRWGLARAAFSRALGISAARTFSGCTPTPQDVQRHLVS